MKNLLIVLLLSIFVSLTHNVQAASVTFNPDALNFQIGPGESGNVRLIVQGYSSSAYTLYFRVGSKMENSTVPPGWLNPAYLSLATRVGGASTTAMELTLNIPPDAMAGTYTGVVVPEDLQSSEPISSPGIIVTIVVTRPQSACVIPPAFTDIEIAPNDIWAPAGKNVEIMISGGVSVSDGCDITAGYTMESDAGLLQGDLVLAPDGSFTKKIMATVSRSGKDKEGRVYNGTVFATDSDGNEATRDFFVTVLHDQGEKKGWNP